MRTRPGVVVACALLLTSLVAGCSEQGADEPAPRQTGAPWFDEVEPASSAGSATACAIPVSLPLAEKWLAKPVRQDGTPTDQLIRQGGAALACEIDAKPAGPIGFLRVWVADRDVKEPRPALEAFIAGDRGVKDPAYRDLKAGGMAAVEVTYLRDSPLEKDGKRERAIAVTTPQGIAVVTLSGLNNEQYKAMLPAYALARRSISPAD